MKEPRSPLYRFAFGYSDTPPHWTFWVIVAAMVVFVLYNAITIAPAHAVDCHAAKGAGYPWAWRQIDGRRCWYKGKAGMDKKRLRWPKPSTVGMRPKPPIPVAPPDDPLLRSYWPPLESFDTRFKGERQ